MQVTQIPDSILVDRFRTGNIEAMNALVNRHMPRAYAYAMRLSRDHDMAADVVANTLVRVNRSATRFKGNSSFSTWLHTLIKNCYLDLRRVASLRPTESLDQTSDPEYGILERQFESTAPSPYEMAEKAVRIDALSTAVNALCENQKILVLMFHQEMLSYDEIAAKMKLPIGTVKSRLHRARIELQRVLKRDRFLLGVNHACLS